MAADPDGPAVEVTPAMEHEFEHMRRTAALAAYYYSALKAEHLPDAMIEGLVVGWQSAYLESELIE